MKGLIKREGPDLRFILPEHAEAFEKKVIEIYMRRLPHIPGKLPYIERDILMQGGMEPRLFVPAHLAYLHKDEGYFRNETRHMTEREIYNYTRQVAQEYEMKINPLHDDFMYDDMCHVLDFHRMSYIDVDAEEAGKKYYRHFPLQKVW